VTDGSLDHLHVAIAPLLKALIQVNQALTNGSGVVVFSVNGEQDILHAFVGFIANRNIAA
jgi:hypothetical protein